MIISIDCIVLVISLGIANYIRHGKFFRGLNDPKDMKVLVAVFLVVFLVINLYKNLYKQMLLRLSLIHIYSDRDWCAQCEGGG